MRTLIVCNITSVDGFFSSADGDPLVLNMDEAFDLYNLERISRAEIVLLGRESYVGFSSYWPHIADAPVDDADPALDEVNRDISRHFTRLPKVVVSDSLVVDPANPWHATTTVLQRRDVAEDLARLKTDGDGEMVVFGSHVMWNGLMAEGLVDEIHLMVSPHPLGEGVPLFTAPAQMRLAGTRTFDGSDNVVLQYAVGDA